MVALHLLVGQLVARPQLVHERGVLFVTYAVSMHL